MRGFKLLEFTFGVVVLALVITVLDKPDPCPEHGVLIRHESRDCAVLQHVDGMQEWQCDDGCWYKGTWQTVVETNLLCPEDGNDERKDR